MPDSEPRSTTDVQSACRGTSGKPRRRRWELLRRIGKKLFRGVCHDYLAKHSLVPNDPVLDPRYFRWAEQFRSNWNEIRVELETQFSHRAALPSFQDISPDQYRISTDDRWKIFVLYGFGHRSELACQLCPATVRALETVPRLESAFFSALAPGKHVPRHRGVTKGMIRCHLALKVPKASEDCWMEVGNVRCRWREGELLFFDDTCPHEVHNDTNEERAVLLFDFERPMTRRGRCLSRLMMRALRHTAYFKDARRNQARWEQRHLNPLSE